MFPHSGRGKALTNEKRIGVRGRGKLGPLYLVGGQCRGGESQEWGGVAIALEEEQKVAAKTTQSLARSVRLSKFEFQGEEPTKAALTINQDQVSRKSYDHDPNSM